MRTHVGSQKEMRVHVGKLSFGPKYLVHGILIHGVSPRYVVRGIDRRYLVQGIGPKWFWSMVLRKAYKLYNEEKIIRPRWKRIEYLMKCEIQYASYVFMMLCSI